MINTSEHRSEDTVKSGVVEYPIGFKFYFNPDRTPQLRVKIGDEELRFNHNFELSEDKGSVVLRPTEEESWTLEGPEDFSWMTKWNGKDLLIERDVPFVQDSDYQLGRISSEQIERDFDLSVMRDQEVLHRVSDFAADIALNESLANAAVETANEAAATSNQATATANTALDSANTAVATANEAKTIATQASKDAVDAMADAASAVNKADAADITATTAMETVAEAVAIAQGAEAAVANKQDKLVAGQGITIDGNTISATDGYNKAEIDNKISVIEADIDNKISVIEAEVDNKISANKTETDNKISANKTEIDNKISVIEADVGVNTSAIQKTRADFIAADTEINTTLNKHTSELTTLRNDVDGVEGQVSGIEEKIPDTANTSNPLVTKQQLQEEAADIREDLNSGLNELQTQVTAQNTVIAGKQKQLQPGDNVFINRTNPNYDTISVANVVSSLNGVSGALNLQAGSGIEIDGLKISATGGGSGGASYTAGDGIDITDNTISVDSSVVKNNAVANNLENSIIVGDGATGSHGGTAVGAQSNAGQYALALGTGANASGTSCVAIGPYAKADSTNTYQIGPGTNSNSNTLQFRGYKLVNADGSIPTDRYTATPTSAGTYIPKLTIAEDGTATREWGTESGGAGGDYLPLSGGTLTDTLTIEKTVQASYWNAYFLTFKQVYPNGSKSLSIGYDGTSLALSGADLSQVGNIQPSGGGHNLGTQYSPWKKIYAESIINGSGGSLTVPTEGGTLARLEDLEGIGGGGASLPDQTDNAGKFLMTDGTKASWGEALVNKATGYGSLQILGNPSIITTSSFCVCLGKNTLASGGHATALGYAAKVNAAYAVQIGDGLNEDANTFKVANNNGNFEMMDADGNVPLERLTYVTNQIGDISTALTAILGE